MSASSSSSSYTPCSNLQEELDNLRSDKFKDIGVTIHAATRHFVTWSYQRTPHARIKATFTFPDDYCCCSADSEQQQHRRRPNLIICDVSWVPPGLKKKLERLVVATVTGQEQNHHHHHTQVEAAVQCLVRFVDTNLFVPCWKELRQVVDRIQQQQQDSSSSSSTTIQTINETKGLVVLKLQSNRYFYTCSIRIDPGYPSTATHEEWGRPCKLAVKSTNFPARIESILTCQARELVRRMQDGMTANEALRTSNPIQVPVGKDEDDDAISKQQARVKLSQKTLKGLKHDIETLSHVRELRGIHAATTTQQGNAAGGKSSRSARERKEARRAIGKITKEEREQDAKEEEEEWQRQEQERLASYNLPEGDTSPQPSLLSLVTFLQSRIQRLPEEICPVCQKRALPEHPDALQALYAKTSSSLSEKEKKARRLARKQRPVRTYCGCWYHHECLDKFMTEPPFGAACPTPDCGRQVYHPEWPADRKELERAWANRQARQREIEDAAMFL